MAKELAHFTNFAKLKDTSVAFNDITVIAGKPGTGKSYVMKMMYAISETLYLAHNDLVNNIYKANKLYDEANKLLSNLDNGIESLNSDDVEYLKENLNQTIHVGKILDEANSSLNNHKNFQYENVFKNLIDSIFSQYNQISDSFQVGYQSININFSTETLIEFDKNKKFNDINEIIFVETPLILEFKKFMKREKGKTPYHIESLLNILDTDYSFTDEEQDNLIKDFTQKSREIIRGDIESSGDSFIFNKEDDKNYDIVNTSSGTKSIGLLQYLVTNKALKKGSVLYWEEPEVHLHPEWQLKMIDLFVELMNAGVKIVFSTHSPYMPDYLNAISKRRGFDDRISFNLFKESNGIVENHILNDDAKWQMLQDELLGALEEIMWEYI